MSAASNGFRLPLALLAVPAVALLALIGAMAKRLEPSKAFRPNSFRSSSGRAPSTRKPIYPEDDYAAKLAGFDSLGDAFPFEPGRSKLPPEKS